jgi:hypothetical protein
MQQVADWLQKLGLGQYAQRFAENDIDASVLPHLTDHSLKELGVSLGHRLKILAAVQELGGPTSAPPQPPTPTETKPQDTAERRQVTVMFSDRAQSWNRHDNQRDGRDGKNACPQPVLIIFRDSRKAAERPSDRGCLGSGPSPADAQPATVTSQFGPYADISQGKEGRDRNRPEVEVRVTATTRQKRASIRAKILDGVGPCRVNHPGKA